MTTARPHFLASRPWSIASAFGSWSSRLRRGGKRAAAIWVPKACGPPCRLCGEKPNCPRRAEQDDCSRAGKRLVGQGARHQEARTDEAPGAETGDVRADVDAFALDPDEREQHQASTDRS